VRRRRRRACRQAGRDDQKSERETGGENPNHAEPPKAPSDEKPHEAGTAKPDGSATKHGTPQPAAKASDAHEPEPAPQKQKEEEEEGATPTGQADDGNEKSGAPADATARTNATERAAKVPRETPRGAANDATENTRSRDEATDARTAASTPEAHPTNTEEEEKGEEARTDRHADSEAGATEREPENPTTGAPERAATTEEGKRDDMTATEPDPNPRPGRAGGAGPFACESRPATTDRPQAAPGGEHACAHSRRGAALGWRRLRRAGGVNGAERRLRPATGTTRAKPNCAHGPTRRAARTLATTAAKTQARRAPGCPRAATGACDRASARAGAAAPQSRPSCNRSRSGRGGSRVAGPSPPAKEEGGLERAPRGTKPPSVSPMKQNSADQVALVPAKQVRARSVVGGWKWARAGRNKSRALCSSRVRVFVPPLKPKVTLRCVIVMESGVGCSKRRRSGRR